MPQRYSGSFTYSKCAQPGRIDAHRRPHVDLVIVLETLRAHVLPPLDVLRLPVLERALQPLVAGEPDVIGNFLGRNHEGRF